MWKKYGLKEVPKIVLLETNQIIPDKNLFGQSNFVTNTFDVLIQLGTIPKRRDRKSQLSRQAAKDGEMTKNGLNDDAIISVAMNSFDSIPHVTNNNANGELEHVTSVSDVFEMNGINVNENDENDDKGANLNELQTNIGIRSGSASIDNGTRRGTNVMQEGYND